MRDEFMTEPDGDDIVYHGIPQGTVVVETTDGDVIGILPHLSRHSPTGFSWGYAGSGPADLARSLLSDAIGDEATCPVCSGAGGAELLSDGTERPAKRFSDQASVVPCFRCDSGSLVTSEMYQQYKFDVIVNLGEEWRIPRSAIRAWWKRHSRVACGRRDE